MIKNTPRTNIDSLRKCCKTIPETVTVGGSYFIKCTVCGSRTADKELDNEARNDWNNKVLL